MPEDWKNANVTLAFKKKEDPADTRPVSLTLVPGKVMERLILETMWKPIG